VYYDDNKDSFLIKKKKTKNINYTIVPSDDESITDILNLAGIHSEYEPRFAVMLNNEIVGGSTYKIDEDNIYNFDIGILDEYQGYGISKELISNIIYDAKVLKADGIKALVVNNTLFDYLTTIGFKGSVNSEIRYVYKMF
jgi:N-acetylglutamate synthase-like GNAT family acetyltransferase